MEAKQMALAAYNGMLAELAEVQQRIVLHDLVAAKFGDNALPIRDFFRRILPIRQQGLTDRSYFKKEGDGDLRRAKELATAIREMERLFKQQHEMDDEAWVQAVADYIKAERKRA